MLSRARPGLFAGKSPACGSVQALRQMPAHIESPVHFPSLAVDNQTRVLSLWESRFNLTFRWNLQLLHSRYRKERDKQTRHTCLRKGLSSQGGHSGNCSLK